MFLYSLYSNEVNIVFTHEKQFSIEEFESMCKQAPLGGLEIGRPFYSYWKIMQHLVENCGFQCADYTADFCVDIEVDLL